MAVFHKNTPGFHGAFARKHGKGTATAVTVPEWIFLLAKILHPDHEALGIIICAVSAVPNQTGADVLAKVINGRSQVGDNGKGGVLVAGTVANPPVGRTAGILLSDEEHGVHQTDDSL